MDELDEHFKCFMHVLLENPPIYEEKNVPIYFLSFLSNEDSDEYSSMSEQVDCFGRADESQSHWKMKGNYGGPNFKKSFWKGVGINFQLINLKLVLIF